ncbi:hypothetical protein GGI12_004183 [Dipsacomyces acuminosporus]|nr:hypothetical protein GGI12_004183 [Dipsacomyces acuminosporus]
MPRMTDEQRIQAAAKLGLKVDPVGTSDMVSVIATLVILGLMAILVILAWINRGYKPIKAKNLLNAFHIFLTTTCGVIIAIHTLYIYLTRNIRSSFNEFREGLIIYLVLMADLFVTVFLHIMVKAYPLHKRVRIVSVIVDLLCGCTPVVVLLAHPLYMCYFRHDEYLVKWVGKIREEGMAEVYKLQGITTSMSISAHKNTGKLTSKAAILEDGFGSEQTASSNTCVDRVTAIGDQLEHFVNLI